MVAIYDDNYAIAVEHGRRVWRIRAKRIVLATGAIERPRDLPRQRPARASCSPARSSSTAVPTARRRSPAAGARASTSGARPAAACAGTTGSARPCPTASCAGSSASAALTGEGLPDAPAFALPDGDEDAMFVDLERDSTVADVRRAIGAGLRSVEHVKRYTTIGTGSEQGKTRERQRDPRRGGAARRAPGRARHDDVPSAVHARSRSRCSPAATAASSSTRCASRRSTRAHVAGGRGAARTSASGSARATSRATARTWTRPCGASARAARESVAKMDATTLGKIDVQGPDAVEFLNRMYTNAFDSLAVGTCRYARHVQARRDGLRRRRRHARRRAAVPLHDDDRQRRARARLDGGVAADRVAGAARVADLGDRAVGDRRRRRARLARAAGAADRRSRSTARASRSWRSARARSRASRRASAASASRASSPSR